MTFHDVNADAMPRPDWRDSLALAADLALLGILTGLACLPVVTAGAALATASAAADHACVHRGLPSMAQLWTTFRRALLPGLGATATVLGLGFLLAVDLKALGAGVVPGGPVLVAVTIALAVAGFAIALVALVRVGVTGGQGWRAAFGWAARRLAVRPWAGAVVLLVVALPAVLALTIPVTALVVPGLLLFALHVTVRRIAT